MKKDDYLPDMNDPYFRRLNIFLEASNSESERGRVLVASSLIEEMLDEIIRARLLEGKTTELMFDGGNAPLGTYSAKSRLSRSLCLISDEEYRDIDIIRKIRNKFAHSVLCSLEDQQIESWAKNLKVGMGALDELEKGHKSRVDDAAARFSMVSTSLVNILYNRAHYVRGTKVSDVHWPG